MAFFGSCAQVLNVRFGVKNGCRRRLGSIPLIPKRTLPANRPKAPLPPKEASLWYNEEMKNIIQFLVTEEDGTYTADGVNVPIVTEGGSFEELRSNIRAAVALYFDGDDPASLGFGASPSILTNFELSPLAYEGSA
jgi:hypothetical protein